MLAKRIAAVEGGAFGVATASGSSAVFYSLVNLAQNGDNIAYSNKIYGGSQTLLVHVLKRFGIEGRVFDIDNLSSLEKIIDDKTKAIFFESLSNPQIAIADVETITNIAKKHKIVTICDNTVATPILFRPFDFGVDVSVHSLTKYINGHGSGLGGAVIEREGLNELIKDNSRYPAFNTPDESYHGLIYANLPLPIFSIRILIEWLRNIGASLSPQNAWIHFQGLETLELRIQKHSDSALEIAKFLESHKKVKEVNYPGLTSSPYHNLLKKYFKDSRASGLLSFEAQSYEEAKKICDSLTLYSITANIGDSKSLVIHPASTQRRWNICGKCSITAPLSQPSTPATSLLRTMLVTVLICSLVAKVSKIIAIARPTTPLPTAAWMVILLLVDVGMPNMTCLRKLLHSATRE